MNVQGTNAPTPPAGYGTPIKFVYPRRVLQVGSLVLIGLALPALFWWTNRWNFAAAYRLLNVSFLDAVVMLITVIVTIFIHEGIHGLVYARLGYKVTYGVSERLDAAFAAAFQQFQSRNHNIIVALAPLFVLTLVGLLLLTIPDLAVQRIAFTIVLFNTGGSIGDLYLTWRLLRLPPKTLLYDANKDEMYILLPIT
jgi:hypothetical protein